MSKGIKYIRLGSIGYCFDNERSEVRRRSNGVETIIQGGTEEMGRANDALTGNTLGYGVGEQGDVITKEEYQNL